MNTQDILNFTNSVNKFSTEELESLANTLDKEIARMTFNIDAVTKLAIVTSLLKERKNG